MPKINIDSARTDKAEIARYGAICDLIEIELNEKMYINQKKQLQQLVINLYKLGFYLDKKSIFDKNINGILTKGDKK